MRALLVVTVAALPLAAAPPDREFHESAFFDGKRVGYHAVTSGPEPGGKFTRVTATLDLTLARYGSAVKLRREEGARQTADGKTFATFMTQAQAGGKGLSLTGTVYDDKLSVRILPLDAERWVRWDEAALDPWRHLHQFAERKLAPGDKATFTRWEPTYNAVLTVRVTARDRERTIADGGVRELLRVELAADPLESGKTRVVPPRQTWWLDEQGVPARRSMSLDGLGTLTLLRTAKDKALAPTGPAAPDVGRASFAPIDRAVPRPYETHTARYRVTVRDDEELVSLFPSDDHQTAAVVGGKVELTVAPARSGSGGEKPKPEYLAPNAFIDHDDDRVIELAKRAAGDERDGWKKAVRVERFVRNLVVNDGSAALVPASKIARTPRGDCRHHAFLTAALLRANGLPSRTAIGFLYVHRGGPVFGFHMWTEVLIDGRWRGLDSTLGRGGVSAAHVKVSDHGWHDTASFTPLLPAQRVVGKVRFELLSAE
ncbi:MAG: transglutaminase-like domain-containing protein [Gemmataceae bacterium]